MQHLMQFQRSRLREAVAIQQSLACTMPRIQCHGDLKMGANVSAQLQSSGHVACLAESSRCTSQSALTLVPAALLLWPGVSSQILLKRLLPWR